MPLTLMSPVVVNGVDFTPFLKDKGLTWSLRYVHGTNEGLTLAGKTQLDILANKVDLDFACIPLSYAQVQTVLAALAPLTFPVSYDDPLSGYTTKTMHASGQSAAFLKEMPLDGIVSAMWDGISFKLEEL
ncbi:MAG: hypothetical protein IKF99_17600 [Oscillospiraceae bacterium]|nr:hypothetical protein [Oscillospiraceae bacterium]